MGFSARTDMIFTVIQHNSLYAVKLQHSIGETRGGKGIFARTGNLHFRVLRQNHLRYIKNSFSQFTGNGLLCDHRMKTACCWSTQAFNHAGCAPTTINNGIIFR